MPLFSRAKASSSFDAGSIAHKGWLYKEGELNKEFRRRFFALSGTHVAYFKDEADVAKGASKGGFTADAFGHLDASSVEAYALETSAGPEYLFFPLLCE